MSTLNGTIVETDTKQSKKGNTYHRLKVRTADGQTSWWTYFGNLHGQYMNADCAFVLKPMGDGQIIDDYHITAAGEQPFTVPDATAPAAAPVAGSSSVVGKDMWIFAEVVFQYSIKDFPGDIKELTARSVDAAIFADTVFKMYAAKGASEARKLIRSALTDSPEHRVAEMQEQATQGGAESPASITGDFDDDIPF